MWTEPKIDDYDARRRALDPLTSFIVQAPAGSGKTALLTQRFMVLLASVDAPEEIIAITFTRKAAAEMRHRVLTALEQAKCEPLPELEYEQTTWQLAQKVLARDSEKGWELLDNPGRLRIQTIDALCASLARQMPLLSGFGSVPMVTEDPGILYSAAARGAIESLEGSDALADSIAHLVSHLDNRIDNLQQLITSMLGRRDQWLRHIVPDEESLERESLEAALKRIVVDQIEAISQAVPNDSADELSALLRFAADNLRQSAPQSMIHHCVDIKSLPGAQVSDREQWEGIAELLLTKDGSWRKSITKAQGFPAASSAADKEEKALLTQMKTRMTTLLEHLQQQPGLLAALAPLKDLPAHCYTDNEWQTLKALIQLLRMSVAHLQLVFSEQGQVDFPALSQAAIIALGEPDKPTDLALALDYRIKHLLVDEFQDTAVNQYVLLQGLTAGWQPDDGHTLFVVGDPMQSIYRFREAEVSNFLGARESLKIGHVALEFLQLTVNFRSQQGIVDWINASFSRVLPAQNNATSGAVSYASSTAFHRQLDGRAAYFYPSLVKNHEAEAQQVVEIVQRSKAESPADRIAILVRSRSHLTHIIQHLQEARLKFQAVDIQGLGRQPVVQDLFAITRALFALNDRIAWLSVLRAPFCGLTLADLHALTVGDRSSTIIDLLHTPTRLAALSGDGQNRISRVLPVVDIAIQQKFRRSLRSSVEMTWVSLGGPATVQTATGMEDAEVYLQLLEKLDAQGDIPDMDRLGEQVAELYALADVDADDSLQLMTIHKAKGLEFDTVIIPGLSRTPRGDDRKLMEWLELGSAKGALLLAPISAQGEDNNLIAAYLRRLSNEKALHENGRLLYVAATRAKKRLHLFGYTGTEENKGEAILKKPPQSSLLGQLWPVVEPLFQELLEDYDDEQPVSADSTVIIDQARIRLPRGWMLPEPEPDVRVGTVSGEYGAGQPIEFVWAGETARHVGSVVHRLLQKVGDLGLGQVDEAVLQRFESISVAMLKRCGVPRSQLKTAVDKVNRAIRNSLDDERGQWIFSERHQNAECELAISELRDGKTAHMIIDRTFIDDAGTRWIIDYKTGSHSGSGVEAFLDGEQERYRAQLEGYARAMRKMADNPVRLGLFFPLIGGWREWA